MENHNEPVIIEVNGKSYSLIPVEFDESIDMQAYLKIDYSNILGELLTFPICLNQISNLKSEVEALVSSQKLDIDILKANLEKEFKIQRSASSQKTTNADVESYIKSNVDCQKAERALIHFQKNLSYMNGFYWSAQAKNDALTKLSDKLSPTEFSTELLEKSVNNVLVKRIRI